MTKEITVESLKTGAESLGLKSAKIKDVEGGIKYIKSFFEGEGAELDYDCEECKSDIPDVDICPFCAEDLTDGSGEDSSGTMPDPEEKETKEDPEPEPEPEKEEEKGPESEPKAKPKKKGSKTVAKDKKKKEKKAKTKDKKKAAPKAKVSGDGDKLRDTIVELMEKHPLVKKGVAEVKKGKSRISFWGPKGLIAKIFSVKGVAWMYMKEAEKKVVKLGGSKLHVRKLETAVKGLPTRYDLPSVSEIKQAMKVVIGIAEEQAEEAEKEEKKAPKKEKKEKKEKKAKKASPKKKASKGKASKKTTKKKK